MIDEFLSLNNLSNIPEFDFTKESIVDILQDYHFYHLSKIDLLQENEKQNIIQKIKDSKIILINKNENLNQVTNSKYIIIGFEKTLILLNFSSIGFLQMLLSSNSTMSVCFLSNTKDLIKDQINISNREIQIDSEFKDELNGFTSKCRLIHATKRMKQIFSIIFVCISGYLIQKAYMEQQKYHVEQFIEDKEKNSLKDTIISENEYVELRTVGIGSAFQCILIYHIKRGELYVIKKPIDGDESLKLMKREANNYSQFAHPFLPKFYGTVKDKKYVVNEFVRGKALDKSDLSFDEKINIIFELIILIKYFNDNGYIYRDLKPNNLIIDKNKTVILIDLDRMIKSENLNEIEHTLLWSNYVDPEINFTKKFTYQSDIYSLGKIIDYLMIEESDESFGYTKLIEIANKCLNKIGEKRPSISVLLKQFSSIFTKQIQIENLCATFEEHANKIQTIIQAINKNDPEAEFLLGGFYSTGIYLKYDINKGIHFFTLAAQKNNSEAQFCLGSIYEEGKYLKRDITKMIHYYSLSANAGNEKSQFKLGYFYQNGIYINCDINKAIYYYSLASNHNHPEAQFNLSVIYLSKKYGTFDINKAIYYLKLAANQNVIIAQFNLGKIYDAGTYVARDIEKAINYFSLAADHNYLNAQLYLGILYLEDNLFDIQKAIYYFTLAANQNCAKAQMYLGFIYFKYNHILHDIKKAIHYFSLAANQSDADSQFYLGKFYEEGEHVKFDINNAIYYYTLAANQNHL